MSVELRHFLRCRPTRWGSAALLLGLLGQAQGADLFDIPSTPRTTLEACRGFGGRGVSCTGRRGDDRQFAAWLVDGSTSAVFTLPTGLHASGPLGTAWRTRESHACYPIPLT